MTELERQIAETKIECLEDFRKNLLHNLMANEKTQIYRNFTEHVAYVTETMIKEEKERYGLCLKN